MPIAATAVRARAAAGVRRLPRACAVLAIVVATTVAACGKEGTGPEPLAAGRFDVAASGGLVQHWQGAAEHSQSNDYAYMTITMFDGEGDPGEAQLLLEHYGRPGTGSYAVVGTGEGVPAPDSGTFALSVYTPNGATLTRLYLSGVTGTVQLDSASSWEFAGRIDVTGAAHFEGGAPFATPVRIEGRFRSAPFSTR